MTNQLSVFLNDKDINEFSIFNPHSNTKNPEIDLVFEGFDKVFSRIK